MHQASFLYSSKDSLLSRILTTSFVFLVSTVKTQVRDRNYEYSLWQTEKNVFPIISERTFMQKLNCILQNPMRAGFG